MTVLKLQHFRADVWFLLLPRTRSFRPDRPHFLGIRVSSVSSRAQPNIRPRYLSPGTDVGVLATLARLDS